MQKLRSILDDEGKRHSVGALEASSFDERCRGFSVENRKQHRPRSLVRTLQQVFLDQGQVFVAWGVQDQRCILVSCHVFGELNTATVEVHGNHEEAYAGCLEEVRLHNVAGQDEYHILQICQQFICLTPGTYLPIQPLPLTQLFFVNQEVIGALTLNIFQSGDDLSHILISLVMIICTIIFMNIREASQGISLSTMKYVL